MRQLTAIGVSYLDVTKRMEPLAITWPGLHLLPDKGSIIHKGGAVWEVIGIHYQISDENIISHIQVQLKRID